MREFNKLFCIGLTKTGTNSLTRALEILHIPIRHYPDSDKTFKLISNGFFNIPELEDRRGISDIMAATYFSQFDKEYPGSLFILTTRNKENWLESCRVKLKGTPKASRLLISRPYDIATHLRIATYGVAEWDEDRFSYVYDKHLAEVSRYFKRRPDDLLVLNICDSEDKWEPLCKFLDVPVPDKTFPHLRQSTKWQKREANLKRKEDASTA
jgi:hypothetical protein